MALNEDGTPAAPEQDAVERPKPSVQITMNEAGQIVLNSNVDDPHMVRQMLHEALDMIITNITLSLVKRELAGVRPPSPRELAALGGALHRVK